MPLQEALGFLGQADAHCTGTSELKGVAGAAKSLEAVLSCRGVGAGSPRVYLRRAPGRGPLGLATYVALGGVHTVPHMGPCAHMPVVGP